MKHIIYKIINLINGKIYIGKHSTENLDDGYFGSGICLKNAIKKHGEENFIKEILFVFNNEQESYLKEAEIVNAKFVLRKDTYNLVVGGEGFASGEDNFMFGKHHTDETKKKISKANKSEKNYMFGKHHTEECKKRLSEINTGENHPMFGKHLSEEHKGKIRESNKGKTHTKESKHKMSESSKGKHHSRESKKKMSESRGMTQKIVTQRREDVKNISQIWGYITKLAKKWEIGHTAASKFIKTHALDLINSE